MKFSILIFIALLFFRSSIFGLNISCVLSHSASAGLDDRGKIDVHTSEKDSIEVRIKGLGQKYAYFNDDYKLTLIKKDENAYYYQQETIEGLIIWTYFIKSNTITYAKIRTFPITGEPSSYLMISKCNKI